MMGCEAVGSEWRLANHNMGAVIAGESDLLDFAGVGHCVYSLLLC